MEFDSWKVQVSIKSGDLMLNVRGDTVEEVAAQLQAAEGFAVYTTFLQALEGASQQAAVRTLAPVAALQATPQAAPAAPASRGQYRNPNAPRTEKQAALITKLGGVDDPNLTVEQAGAYIDKLLAARRGG